MRKFENILAAVDTRHSNTVVLDQAAELARRFGSRITLVDVLPDFPWLIDATMPDVEDVRRRLGEQKLVRLKQLAKPLQESGLNVTPHVLYGQSSVELTKQVVKNRHDLLIRLAKGYDSARKGSYGGTAQRLLRQCPCAVWLLTADADPHPQRIVAAVNTSSDDPIDAQLNNAVVDAACSIGEQFQSQISVVHVWAMWDDKHLLPHLGRQQLEDFRKATEDQTRDLFQQFVESKTSTVRPELLHGDTAESIASFVDEHESDLLVMGTVARSWLAGALVGNTAERILNQLHCSLLALKPDSFQSTWKLN